MYWSELSLNCTDLTNQFKPVKNRTELKINPVLWTDLHDHSSANQSMFLDEVAFSFVLFDMSIFIIFLAFKI